MPSTIGSMGADGRSGIASRRHKIPATSTCDSSNQVGRARTCSSSTTRMTAYPAPCRLPKMPAAASHAVPDSDESRK